MFLNGWALRKDHRHFAITNLCSLVIVSFVATISTNCGVSRANSVSSSSQGAVATSVQLTILTQTLPGATLGTPYSASLTAVGGVRPYFWAISSGALPAGIELDSHTGLLSGTATQVGAFAFEANVTDRQRTRVGSSLSILVSEPPPPLIIATQALSPAVVGSPYDASLTATGGSLPYTWAVSSGALPAGIELNPDTGLLFGSATQAGTFGFQATVTDSREVRVSAALSIFVSAPPPPLVITTQTLPSATVDTPYLTSLTASGGTPPYTWTVDSGALPVGIELGQDTGLLSGSATQAGLFAFEANVVDSHGSQAYASMSILATDSTLATPAQLPLFWVNNQEWQGTATYTVNFPSVGSGGNWTCGFWIYGPYTAGSQSSGQQAINDAESCRTATLAGVMIVLPAGALYSGTTGWTLPQTAGDT
jgi:hypothetical protein